MILFFPHLVVAVEQPNLFRDDICIYAIQLSLTTELFS